MDSVVVQMTRNANKVVDSRIASGDIHATRDVLLPHIDPVPAGVPGNYKGLWLEWLDFGIYVPNDSMDCQFLLVLHPENSHQHNSPVYVVTPQGEVCLVEYLDVVSPVLHPVDNAITAWLASCVLAAMR